MHDGADVIYQATLAHGRWRGRADFLQRTATPSDLGAWSYEVVDTKLARQTRAGTILQLCLYSEMVGAIQGLLPARMHVVTPADLRPLPFRVRDYLAYYRLMQRRLEAAVDAAAAGSETYPDPVAAMRLLPLVAPLRRAPPRRRPPLPRRRHRPAADRRAAGPRHRHARRARRDAPAARAEAGARRRGDLRPRARAGARPARRPRAARAPVHELLEITEGQGLCRLPEPSEGDIFLDFEGDPYAGSGGLEYLLGCSHRHRRGAPLPGPLGARRQRRARPRSRPSSTSPWRACERWPDFHIYHFAPYEPAALKRLMGRYATREDELDRLLRAGRFVDLHRRRPAGAARQRRALLAQGARGLLRLRPRASSCATASLHLRAFERALELGEARPRRGRDARGDRGLQPRRLHLDHAPARLARAPARGAHRRRRRHAPARRSRRARRPRR